MNSRAIFYILIAMIFAGLYLLVHIDRSFTPPPRPADHEESNHDETGN